jgi:3,4-dihydroxy 2-butanone 4-phosphate synthase
MVMKLRWKFMLDEAIRALREGGKILLYDFDDREGETDLVQVASFVKAKDVSQFRKDAGGLICVAIHPHAADGFGLPFMSEILKSAADNGYSKLLSLAELRLPYDERSAFSLWVNHRKTFTGISDKDRALTISELGNAVCRVLKGEKFDFGSEFRSPGHISILRAADRLLLERRGQTELSVSLAVIGGMVPALVICEMLDESTGNALSKNDAKKYAEEKNLVFLEGRDVLGEYKRLGCPVDYRWKKYRHNNKRNKKEEKENWNSS